jgi:hypothetical protein
MEIVSILLGLSLWTTPVSAQIDDNALKADLSPVELGNIENIVNPPQQALEGQIEPNQGAQDWLLELEKHPELKKLADCESGSTESAVNPKDVDGFPKYGLFQYHVPTWLWFQELMGVSGLDIMSGEDQLTVTRWAFSHGKSSHWGVCYP